MSGDLRMERMMLVLSPDAAQQQALDELLAAQQDPASPEYQRWLSPEEFGERFGVSQADVDQVVAWLSDAGFDVEPVTAERRYIVFSGTAAQVADTFQTEIRSYRVNGRLYYANAAPPRIPRALAEVVQGIASLHNFHSAPQNLGIAPQWTGSSTSHYLAPGDFAKIYDSASLLASGIDGTNQSIAVIGRTNINLADAQKFRTTFGLPANDPAIVLNGTDPGIVSADEQGEAMLDIEWAGAVAPKAAIKFVVSKSTASSDGVALSAQYAVTKNVAPVMTLSFGLCESVMGTTYNQFWNSLWQQAAAQGITVLVSSGDSGAAGCDAANATTARSGKGVNGLCSSPYSTCVGGTQFDDTANPSLYWAATNGANYTSALGYVPEMVWNQSAGTSGGSGLWATGGGLSTIYTKPTWQTGAWVPAATMRAVPDISLAASGITPYIIYMNGGLYATSGTSASAPAMAGLMALAAQRTASRLGNVNPSLYSFASRQASGGVAVFHDIVKGNNSVPGVTGFNATAGYDYATGLGSVSASLLVNNWTATSTPTTPTFDLALTPTSASLTPGASTTVSVKVTPTGSFTSAVALTVSGAPSGLTAALSPTSVAGGNGTSTLTLTSTSQLAAGSYNLTVTGTGGGVTKTATLPVAVSAATCTYTISPTTASIAATASTNTLQVTTGSTCSWTATPSATWIRITAGASGKGNGSISWSAEANSATAVRSGSIAVGGKSLAITQAAVPFALSATTASVAAAASTGTVSVTASSSTATWTATSAVSWITITAGASGKGSASVSYSVAANTAATARAGTLTIAGLTYTVTQAALACSYTVTPTSQSVPAAGGAFTVQVTAASSACSWTAAAGASFVTIKSGASGTGNGSVSYSVAANTSAARTGSLTVAGTIVILSQAAGSTATSVTLSTKSVSVPTAGGKGTFTVTAATTTTTWTATSNVTWITITSGSSGKGSGTVAFTVAANTGSAARTGVITVAGQTVTVDQAGAACTYSLGAASITSSATGFTLTLPVTTGASCTWTASSSASWISLSSASPTTGSGKAIFQIGLNKTGAARTGTVAVAGYTITINQSK